MSSTTEPLVIDPSEPTARLLSRLFFAADGKSVSVGEPNEATALVIENCRKAFFIDTGPYEVPPFERFRQQYMHVLGLEGPYTVNGKSADWVTVWNVANLGTDRCVTLAFTAAYEPDHRIEVTYPEPEAPHP